MSISVSKKCISKNDMIVRKTDLVGYIMIEIRCMQMDLILIPSKLVKTSFALPITPVPPLLGIHW